MSYFCYELLHSPEQEVITGGRTGREWCGNKGGRGDKDIINIYISVSFFQSKTKWSLI